MIENEPISMQKGWNDDTLYRNIILLHNIWVFQVNFQTLHSQEQRII